MTDDEVKQWLTSEAGEGHAHGAPHRWGADDSGTTAQGTRDGEAVMKDGEVLTWLSEDEMRLWNLADKAGGDGASDDEFAVGMWRVLRRLAETRKVFARFCQRAASVPLDETLRPIEDREIVEFHEKMPSPHKPA